MGIQWARGTVTEIVSSYGTMQEVSLRMPDGSCCKAIHDMTAFAPLQPGDEVVANTTAVTLGLGTGGSHFVYYPLSAESDLEAAPSPGHIMKLRYTSLQRAVLAVEETESPHHEAMSGRNTLERMPVLIGELHSMLPAAVCWLRHIAGLDRPLRIAYVMTDGGALPIDISRHVDRLNRLGWLAGTVTYGHAYGGDVEAVNKYTAMLAAKHVLQADIAIVTMGPGIVGTGTVYGYTGIETGELVNAVRSLNGIPVYIPRVSFQDKRDRHYGLSHHSRTALADIAVTEAIVPIPLLPSNDETEILRKQSEASQLGDKHQLCWLEAPSAERMEQAICEYGAPITSMGRGLRDDPSFFAAVSTAADAAFRLVPSPDP